MSSGEDLCEQRRVGRGPASFRRRRHVDDLEESASLVQHGNRTMRARVDSEDGLGSHLHAPFEDREKREVREVREICPVASRHERAGKREVREEAPLRGLPGFPAWPDGRIFTEAIRNAPRPALWRRGVPP